MKKVFCVILVISALFAAGCPVYAVSAKAAVVINGDTGDILYSKNADVRLPMASTTKIMTALILLENCVDLDGEIVTAKEMVTVEGSSMGLLEGDRVSYRALLYGMMLASGNDAANTVAIAIGGSVEKFVGMMNAKAAELNLKSTHFVTPSGLDAEGHYTTAYELALITREALKNPDFALAAAAKSATLCYGNPPYRRTLTNHNRLLFMYDDVIGVKTGFTKKSGRCLVSAAKKDGKYVIAVTLNDGDDWADHRFLLDAGLGAIEVYDYKQESKTVSIPVIGGEFEAVEGVAGAAGFSITKGQDVKIAVCAPRFLYAPIEENAVVASIEYYGAGRLLYKSNVTVKRVGEKKISKLNLFFEIFKIILGS